MNALPTFLLLNTRHPNTSHTPTPRTTTSSPVDTTTKERKEVEQEKKKIGVVSMATTKAG